MSYKKAALLFGIGFLLQFSLMNLFSVLGVAPNLILSLMMFMAYKYNDGVKYAALAIPFAILADVAGGQYAGVGALSLLVLLVVISFFGRNLNRDTLWTLLAVSTGGTAIYYFFTWLIMSVLGNPATMLGLLRFLFIALPMNLIAVLLINQVYRRGHRRSVRPTGYAIVDMGMRTKKQNKKMNLRNTR